MGQELRQDWQLQQALAARLSSRQLRPRLSACLQPYLLPLWESWHASFEQTRSLQSVLSLTDQQWQSVQGALRDWWLNLFNESSARNSEILQPLAEQLAEPTLLAWVAAARRQGLQTHLMQSWAGSWPELFEHQMELNYWLDADFIQTLAHYSRLRSELVAKQQRQAVIGQIAGGIAHELRNPLNAIKTSVYFLIQVKEATPAKLQEHLTRINQQSDLINQVISALSQFSRLPEPRLQLLSLNDLVQEVLISAALPAHLRQDLTVVEPLPQVKVDPDQIRLVLQNLLVNASDAMPNGGQLRLRVWYQSPWLRLAVQDEGVGITSEVLPQIFEPLFSTKPRGIGLGLTIAKMVLDHHGGMITVSTQPFRGSTFTISLPCPATHS